jgi:hypothetical protein
LLSVVDFIEQVLIQPFMRHRAVEALDVGALRRLPGLDKRQADATPLLQALLGLAIK